MEYSKIFKRAFDVVRNEPALWIVGIIMAIFGGAGGGSGGSGGNFGGGSGGGGGACAIPKLADEKRDVDAFSGIEPVFFSAFFVSSPSPPKVNPC